RYNKLIFSSGLIADTAITTTGKLSIGGKSPLTGGVKESNVGGSAGKKLAKLGIRALVIEDTPKNLSTKVLVLAANKIELINAPELKGKMVDETIDIIRKKFGLNVGIICIGPAGEMKLYGSGIAVTDEKDIQIRYAARGGLGALMGSKGLKAVVINDNGAKTPKYFDSELLRKTGKEIVQYLKKDPKTENRNMFGTPAIMEAANELGLLPTRNFSSGSFEDIQNITGERVRKVIVKRGGVGRTGCSCVKGCTIQCCNVFPDIKGKKIVASIQYENIALLGPNCGIGNLDDIAEMNNLCNQVGVDAIETGAAIGVLMESGEIAFGDAEAAKDIINQIGKGTCIGRIIGNGTKLTGQVFGVKRIPVIKGQAIPGYDPRALKGNGVTYFTSPMGADHTAGNTFGSAGKINPLSGKEQIEDSKKLQLRVALLDTLGLCLFVRPPFVKHPEFYISLLKGRYGWQLELKDIKNIAEDVLQTEREFNKKAGVSEEFWSFPEFMREEPLPPNDTVFDISREEMKRIWDVKIPIDEF
ncbi:MAG: aldehyde ferredoxin oxidoreductase, partial [Actinobacteria bacterium]|nr:aldehyde ferredoxin oxidoreductase [Actinomycetota bacterium]